MALVYDFKDIASRMKGELKQEPAPELMPCPPTPTPNWRDMVLRHSFCATCNGSGADPMHGGLCNHCNGTGVAP